MTVGVSIDPMLFNTTSRPIPSTKHNRKTCHIIGEYSGMNIGFIYNCGYAGFSRSIQFARRDHERSIHASVVTGIRMQWKVALSADVDCIQSGGVSHL
jgi:NCAIR mutase (PurE)-related protein